MLKFCQALALYAGFAGAAAAQETHMLKYNFTAGQVLRYDGKDNITGASTISGTTQKYSSETSSVREWRVTDVDDQGSARLELRIVRVAAEMTSPNGARIAFDTDKDEEKNPLAAVVGKPIVELTLTASGQVKDLKPSKSAEAGPFVAMVRTRLFPLPKVPVQVGTGWQYDFDLPLPPPLGRTNEQVRIRQTLRLEKVHDGVATINLRTSLAEETKDKSLMSRVAQFLPAGQIELDLKRGVLRSVELKLDQTVQGFSGADSEARITGSSTERLNDDVAGVDRERK